MAPGLLALRVSSPVLFWPCPSLTVDQGSANQSRWAAPFFWDWGILPEHSQTHCPTRVVVTPPCTMTTSRSCDKDGVNCQPRRFASRSVQRTLRVEMRNPSWDGPRECLAGSRAGAGAPTWGSSAAERAVPVMGGHVDGHPGHKGTLCAFLQTSVFSCLSSPPAPRLRRFLRAGVALASPFLEMPAGEVESA